MMKHYFNTNKVLSVTALAIGAITLFFACKKDDKAGVDEKRDTQTMAISQKEVEINAVYEDACGVVLNANFTEGTLNTQGRKAPGNSFFARCIPDIEVAPAEIGVFPKTVTLDFNASCTETSGPSRKGKIKIEINKWFFSTGATATITFEGYSVNGIKVEGTQKLTNLSGPTGLGYSYSVTGGRLTYPDGMVYEYKGERVLTQKEGAATPNELDDDAYEMTGNAELKDSASTAAVKIETPLYRQLTCAYVSKGVLSVIVNGLVAKVDYGNGNCENKAMLTVGDKTKEITVWK